MNGEPMPPGLTLSQQKAFISLRSLHSEYRKGNITIETAASDKFQIVSQLQYEIKADEINNKTAQLWQHIEEPGRRYVFESTISNADRFYAAVYGLNEDWRVRR